MEKEKVLEIKIVKMNDEWSSCCITHQNEEVLKRGERTKFSKSYIYPCWDIIRKELYTYGSVEKYDDVIFTVPKDDINLFLNKINAINEKYGKPKRWRAEMYEKYYYVEHNIEVRNTIEIGEGFDDRKYKVGNYFKTEEEAQLYADKIKKLLSERE